MLAEISTHPHVVLNEGHKKEQQAPALPLPPNRARGALKQGTASRQACVPQTSNGHVRCSGDRTTVGAKRSKMTIRLGTRHRAFSGQMALTSSLLKPCSPAGLFLAGFFLWTEPTNQIGLKCFAPVMSNSIKEIKKENIRTGDF